ncbi:MAG: AAA family ATPase [Methylococcaceae bacterium]|jgi:type II secretory pathway predicted ATPase ExeA
MYTSFFGLKKKPFSLVPDPDFLYLSPKHKRALSTLQYGLVSQAGITVISGEIGSGKTTLIRSMLGKVQDQCAIGLITNTHKSFGDLLTWVLASFDISHKADDKAGRYQLFAKFVMEQNQKNRRVILIVDEAQNMDIETLEELRLLSNINIKQDVLLQLILVGQPELLDKLNMPELVQFAQRISIEYHLKSLNYEETKHYIAHRLQIAGGKASIFDESGCAAVFYFTEGVPRLINNICDLAMVFAFAEDMQEISWKIIRDVVLERKAGGISRFKGVLSNPTELMDPAVEADKLRVAIFESTAVDISQFL